MDTCEAPGFECVKETNIITPNTPTRSSLRIVNHGVKNALDDNKKTWWQTADDGKKGWIMLDLQTRRLVACVAISQLGESESDKWSNLSQMRLLIGDEGTSEIMSKNSVCVDDVDHSQGRILAYYCDKGPMWGRYVIWTTKKNKPIFMSIIHVYPVDGY